MNGPTCVFCLAAGVLAVAATPAWAATLINVPNASFESPSASGDPFYTGVPTDDGSATGQWLGYGGFRAVVKSGGPNGYNVSPVGILGSQFGNQSNQPGTGVFQDLAAYDGSGDPNLYWQPGTYTLAVGLFSRADNPINPLDRLDVKLFYRAAGSRAGDPGAGTLGTTSVTGNQVTTSALTDFLVTVSVSPGDDAIGHPIGIWLDSRVGGTSPRDWGYDNVRLEFTPVPEPSARIVGCGFLILLAIRQRATFCTKCDEFVGS